MKGAETAVRQFVQDQGYDFAILVDPDNSIWEGFGIESATTTVFIDPYGRIGNVEPGAMAADDMASIAHELIGLRFSDVPADHPYAHAIDELASRGIVRGFGNGTFGPDALVTRQQFAKMIVRSLDLPVWGNETSPFVDVPRGLDPTDPFYPDKYVAVCYKLGITEGKTPTTFAPIDHLSRAQLLTFVARAVDLPDPPADYSPPFTPFLPVHYSNARKAAYAGLLDGWEGVGPSFDFYSPATRGEVCLVLYNMLRR